MYFISKRTKYYHCYPTPKEGVWGRGLESIHLSEQVAILCFHSLRGIWTSSYTGWLGAGHWFVSPNGEERTNCCFSELGCECLQEGWKEVCCCSVRSTQALNVLHWPEGRQRTSSSSLSLALRTEAMGDGWGQVLPPALCALSHSRRHFTHSTSEVVKTVLNPAR